MISVFDSGDYLRLALQLKSGYWPLGEHAYAARIFSYVPYTIGICIGGFGGWLTYITFSEFLLLLFLIYFVIGRINKPVAHGAIIALATSPIMLRNSTLITSDMMATLTTNAVVLVYLLFFLRERKSLISARFFGVLTASILAVSLWSKESGAFYMPLLIYFFVKDRNSDGAMKEYWKYAFLSFILWVAATLAIHGVKTGNLSGRLRDAEYLATITASDYDDASFITILLRCTIQPFQFLMQNYTFGILFLLAVLNVVQPANSLIRKKLKAYFIFTISVWWFGSQSLFSWNPVALIHRLWLPVLIPMAINGAFGIYNILNQHAFGKKERQKYCVIIFLFLAAAFISLILFERKYAEMQLSTVSLRLGAAAFATVSLVLLSVINIPLFREKKILAAVLLCLTIVVPQVVWQSKEIITWAERGFTNEYIMEKEMVERVKNLNPSLILTDAGLSRNYGIYDGFQNPLPFAFYMNHSYDSLPDGTYLLLNKEREKASSMNMIESIGFMRASNKKPDFIDNPGKYNFGLVSENETNQLFLLKQSREKDVN